VKQRIALWGVLATLVIGAGALVVLFAGGDDGGTPPALRLAAGSSAESAGADRAAAPMDSSFLATVYVPGDDLPTLGGEAPAYRLAGDVTAGDVADLAGALGIAGEPTETDGSWHVEDGEMALDVYGPDATWSAYRLVAHDALGTSDAAAGTASGAGTSGSPGSSGSAGSSGSGDTPVSSGADGAARSNLAAQACPATPPGADNVVQLCDPPLCPQTGDVPAGPAVDIAPCDPPICLEQPDVATDAKPCEPPVCPQYAQGGAVGATEPAPPFAPCPSPECPGNGAGDFRCMPPSTVTIPPSPGDPIPDPPPTEPVPTTSPPPADVDLPGEDEATDIARDLLAATGADVDDAAVTAENLVSMWSITVEPRLDGRAAPGLAMYVGVGPEGRIESASGLLATPDELGDYPLIDTRAAVTRLNEGWGFGGVVATDGPAAAAESGPAVAADQPATNEPAADGAPRVAHDEADAIAGGAAPSTGRAPGGGPEVSILPVPADPGDPGDVPVVEPQPAPTEVEVTDAEVVLVTVPSWDDRGTYLVPGYRFTAADDSQPTVPAVSDDVLEPPPAPETTDETGVEIQPEPPVASETPGDPVEVTLYHCGFEELRHADRRWVVEDPPFDATNAPPEFVGKGTFAVQDGGGKAVYTDDSGIAVTFVAVDEAWEFPLCE
jgi:hypothetical protein